MRLVIQSGSQTGQVFELTKNIFTIGRATTNDLILSDPSASRNHCQVRREAGGYVIEDSNSANGTYLNGERIFGQRSLQPGNEIRVGQTSLLCEASQPAFSDVVDEPLFEPSQVPVEPQGTQARPFLFVGNALAVFVALGLSLIVFAFLLPHPQPTPPPSGPSTSATGGPMTRAPVGLLPIAPVNVAQVREQTKWGMGPANQIAWSPDGKTMAVASSYGLYFYDAASRQQMTKPITPTNWIWSVAYSPDGALIATGGDDHVIRLWRISGANLNVERELVGHKASVRSVAFSPDGQWLASGAEDSNEDRTTLRLWRLSDGKLVGQQALSTTVYSVAFSPDSKWLASGSADQFVRLWAVSDQGLAQEGDNFRGHLGAVRSVAFSPKGNQVASGSEDYSIRLWTIQDRSSQELKGHIKWVLDVKFDPRGDLLASSGNDHAIRIWQVSDGSMLREFKEIPDSGVKAPTNWVWSVAFSPQGNTLAAASWDGAVWLGHAPDYVPAEPWVSGHTHDVLSLAFSPTDPSLLASGGDDDSVRLFRVRDNSRLEPVSEMIASHRSWVDAVAFSPNGERLASGGRDNIVRLWKVAGDKLSLLDESPPNANWIRSVAFSPITDTVAFGTFRTVNMTSVTDGKINREGVLLTHNNWVRTIAFNLFSQDKSAAVNPPAGGSSGCDIGTPNQGDVFATGSDDGTIRFWRVADRKFICEVRAHTASVRSLAFSPDRNVLASASDDGAIRLWRVNDGTMLQALSGHRGGANALAFTADGALLASGGADKTIRLWQTRDGLMLRELTGHTGSVDSLAFNRGGTMLASGGFDGTIRIWVVRQPQ